MNIYLKIFGYCGTVLVLISMTMPPVKWLRILNLSGAVICAIYGALMHTWPTVVLNVSLLIIHIIQLCRLRRSVQ